MSDGSESTVAISAPAPAVTEKVLALTRGRYPLLRVRVWRSPAFYMLGIAVAAVAIYHVWLTTAPLSAADWPWIPADQLRTWFPWPAVWWPEVGFGLQNFAGVYETPVEAVGGILALTSADWAIIEKVLYFIPFAVLSFIGPWILARELLRSSRWALLSAFIYGTSTYFMTFSVGGQMYLAVAEALAPIVFYATIRALRQRSLKWALVTGLLMGLQAAYEVRITYLTIILCLLYLVVLSATEPDWRAFMQRGVLLSVAFLVLAGTQLYWLLPLITYGGSARLPIAATPWDAFMRLANGITGVAPGWTGGTPATFQYVAVNPIFFLFPTLGFLALSARRISAELLWLSLSALAAAFLIKQTNPPAGGIYDWMFVHIPGWDLFREGSKFYFAVGIAYAILIPVVLREGLKFATGRWSIPGLMAAGGVAAVVGLSAGNLIPLETGKIGFTSHPIAEPLAVRNLTAILDSDHTYGGVWWLGGAWFTDRSGPDPQFLQDHNFVSRSTTHPAIELLGGQLYGDPLVAFCASPETPFCYAQNKQLLSYLLGRTGTRYLVAPASPRVGRFDVPIDYKTLLTRLTSSLGTPQILGDSSGKLALWRVSGETSPIVVAPALTVVDGSAAATENVLPALEALAQPVVYRTTRDESRSLTAQKSIIEVVPGAFGAYNVPADGEYEVLVPDVAQTITITDESGSHTLSRASVATRIPGWAAYGPIRLTAGAHRLYTDAAAGPLVAWSDAANRALSGLVSEKALSASVLKAESVSSVGSAPTHSWIELRRTFDPGWRLDSAATHLTGDDLFNVFFTEAPSARLRFAFTTAPSETIGTILALGSTAAALVLMLSLRRRESGGEDLPQPAAIFSLTGRGRESDPLNTTARYLAIAGIALIVLAAVPQSIGWIQGNTEGYGFADAQGYRFAEYLLSNAVALLALACLLYIMSPAVRIVTRGPAVQRLSNYAAMHSALLEDRLLTKRPAYQPTNWSSLVHDLDGLYPGSSKFLYEAAVIDLERLIRSRINDVGAEGPWALALNGDLTLARCLYLLCRALRPDVIVETGVAYGVSSAFILQALAINRKGTLHSIDLPLPGTAAAGVTGSLIPAQLQDRWHLYLGSSRRELPAIINRRAVDMFVHDSLHTYRNMRREFQAVWPRLPVGGVLVSDDIEGNSAFRELLMERPAYWEVVRQDEKQSLFGIAIKRGAPAGQPDRLQSEPSAATR